MKNLKPLTLDEIERIRMHGLTDPEDFARFAFTAREYYRLRKALEFYADEAKWNDKFDDSYGGWITQFHWKQKDADEPEEIAREALKESGE